jgi:hypothetical protein
MIVCDVVFRRTGLQLRAVRLCLGEARFRQAETLPTVQATELGRSTVEARAKTKEAVEEGGEEEGEVGGLRWTQS